MQTRFRTFRVRFHTEPDNTNHLFHGAVFIWFIISFLLLIVKVLAVDWLDLL